MNHRQPAGYPDPGVETSILNTMYNVLNLVNLRNLPAQYITLPPRGAASVKGK